MIAKRLPRRAQKHSPDAARASHRPFLGVERCAPGSLSSHRTRGPERTSPGRKRRRAQPALSHPRRGGRAPRAGPGPAAEAAETQEVARAPPPTRAAAPGAPRPPQTSRARRTRTQPARRPPGPPLGRSSGPGRGRQAGEGRARRRPERDPPVAAPPAALRTNTRASSRQRRRARRGVRAPRPAETRGEFLGPSAPAPATFPSARPHRPSRSRRTGRGRGRRTAGTRRYAN